MHSLKFNRLALFATFLVAVTTGLAEEPAFKVWNCDVLSDAWQDEPPEVLRPISIVGARNSVFSGKVVIESTGAIEGLAASVGPLTMQGTQISAENVSVRYAVEFDKQVWTSLRPPMLDILLESPPAEVLANKGRALAPVWVTVTIPRDADSGPYKGILKVSAVGLPETTVPIELKVADWTMPDTQDFRTWMGMIQSPDTLALEYEVPMWSERHWELIARSFRHMKAIGCRNLFIPLLCGTNLGNDESMVRWIPRGAGRYGYDFSIMDRYLDVAEEHLGKPKQVIFHIWDVYLSPGAMKNYPGWDKDATAKILGNRQALVDKGARVTAIDPETGKPAVLYLPRYENPASEALWRPLFDGLHQRMKSRGIEDTMTLGLLTDQIPSKEETAMLQKVSGGLPWMLHAHPTYLRGKPATDNKLLHKIADISGEAHVYDLGYNVNPDKGRQYGWNRPELTLRFSRNGFSNSANCLTTHLTPAFNITGTQRGLGRLGADTWFVVRNKKGCRSGAVYHRYPENNWRNLDIQGWMLAPGPDGAVYTSRLENLREGIQECEARICIESALIDPEKKAILGAELAQRGQALLDARHRAMWKSTWDDEQDLNSQGVVHARYPMEALWYGLVKAGKELPGYWDGAARQMRGDKQSKGQKWFAASGWRERNEQLFQLAGEVERKLGPTR